MTVIIKPADIFSAVVGKQKFENGLTYRLLNFCLLINEENCKLLYNNLTKELLELNNAEFDLIESNKFPTDNLFVQALIEKWFLVPTDFDDIKLSNQVLQLGKQFANNSKIKSYEILTTTGCNARCFYCFEANARVVNMSPETAFAVSDYIKENYNNEKVHLKWFGGEPLCNIPAIDIISEQLNKNGILYNANITTNGFLFDEDVVLKAKNSWNLKHVQITLDGMEETYNRVKNYVNSNGSAFERVIKNIGLLLDAEIAVSIRLNLDFYNESELYSLVDYLYNLYGKNKLFSVYASLIFENVGFQKTNRTEDENDIIGEKFLKLIEYLEKLGLKKPSPLNNRILISHCMADAIDSVMISPEGKLGRCEHHIDDDFYGSIFTKEKKQPWSDYNAPIPACTNCPLYPTCLMLKRCNTNVCRKYKRIQNINELKKSVIYTYEKYLIKNNS